MSAHDGMPTSASADVVLRFLESVGRRAEAEFYVQLFRAEPREQFGAIAVDANVARYAFEAVVLHLRFLAGLGLTPVVAFGAFAPVDAFEHAARLVRRLGREGVAAQILPVGDVEGIVAACRAGKLPVLALTGDEGATPDERVDRLGALLGRLQSRKLIFLHRPGGLRANGALLPQVTVPGDVPSLLAARDLTRKERAMVQQSSRLVLAATHRLAVTITSPFNLLRELFTVKGAGTLLRRGAVIARHEGWMGVDPTRLRALIASSFGREPVDAFFARPVLRVYVEEAYRGCAVLGDSPFGPYLTKFATDREARGEGIARDLWDAMMVDSGTVFWRARSSNPINEWYTKLADGLWKTPEWWVFWKGIPLERVPEAIAWALAQPVDLPPPAQGVAATVP